MDQVLVQPSSAQGSPAPPPVMAPPATHDLPRLTRKQEAWLKAYLSPDSETRFNATASAFVAYRCRSYTTAATIGKQNSQKLRHWIDVWRADNGLTPEGLDAVLIEGLRAKKWVVSKTHGFREVPDMRCRAKYLELGYQRFSLLKTVQTVEHSGTVVHKLVRVPDYGSMLPAGERPWVPPALPEKGNGSGGDE